VLGGVLAAVAALPATPNPAAQTFRVTGALFLGFAAWDIVKDIIRRVVRRIRSEVHIPSAEEDSQSTLRKMRKCFVDGWNEQMRQPRALRGIVELVAKCLIAISMSSTFRELEKHTGGAGRAAGRAFQGYATNAAFTTTYFAVMRSLGFVFSRIARDANR